jgi:3-oxoacyl-[acyl-carrier-protein] synthase II
LVIPALLEQARERSGRHAVLRSDGEAASWPDLCDWSARLAAVWKTQVKPGDRVAIVLANGIPHLVAELACWRLGAVAAPMYPGSSADLIRYLVRACHAVLVVGDDVELADGRPFLAAADLWRIARSPGPHSDQMEVQPDTPALLLSTSGSSGLPRGVLLSHRNLCSQQAAYAMLWPEVGPGDRLASYLPWHHSYGALAERLWALVRGACLTVIPGGGRDHPTFLATVTAVAPTVFMSVPKLHRLAILGGALDQAPLRWAFTAGAPIAPAEDAWYAQRGIPLYEGWGMTESGPSATITPPGVPRRHGIVGQPIAGVSVGVRDDGHLLIAGPGVMLGYDGNTAATAACIGHDPVMGRYLDSGDLGQWTDDGLRLEGRADQGIKLANGEKVPVHALAGRLESQPGVRSAVVFSRDGGALEAILAPLAGHDDTVLAHAVAAVNHAEPTHWLRIAHAWRLIPEPTVESGLLTPSMKVVRKAWLAAFEAGQVNRIPACDGPRAAGRVENTTNHDVSPAFSTTNREPRTTNGAIAITGLGAISAHGNGWAALATALAEGRDGLAMHATPPLAARFPVAAVTATLPRGPRTLALARTAATEALRMAGLGASDHLGLVLGSCTGGMANSEAAYLHLGTDACVPAYRNQIIGSTAARLAKRLGVGGPVSAHAEACASAACALAEAVQWIRSGLVPVVVVVGADALTRTTLGGFASLQVIDPRGCQPFTNERAGMSLGEGAVALVLEHPEHARRRGAAVQAELLGWGLAADGHHGTAPEPGGIYLEQTIRAALADADLDPARIDAVSAHGTGTQDNDAVEAATLGRIFGERIPVFSSKRCCGHTMGAAATFGVAAAITALRHQELPPSAGAHLGTPMNGIDVVRERRAARLRHVLVTSLAFGGVDAALVVGNACA